MIYVKTTIIYHKGCIDGLTAAWAINHLVSGQLVFLPKAFGSEFSPEEISVIKASDRVIMVDVTFDKQIMMLLEALVPSGVFTVLDHHKSGKEDMSLLVGKSHVWDANRSGAGLAWSYVTLGKETPPPIVQFVEDRDLWRFKLPHSKAINAFIHASVCEYKVEEIDRINNELKESFDACVEYGEMLLKAQAMQVERICKNTFMLDLNNVSFVCVNTNYAMSDVGNRLTELHGLPAAVFFQKDADTFKWSLRSSDSMEDVSIIAESFGGGGHRNASGFRINFDDHFDLLGAHTYNK